MPVAFANSGAKQPIPIASQVSITPGRASYTDGFPPLTRTPLSAGGIPPYGTDFNGVLNEITASIRWANAGMGYTYDSDFSSSVGGYPKGAQLIKATSDGIWLNAVEGNTTNPDTGGAGWSDMTSGRLLGIKTFPTSGTYTPTAGTKKIRVKVWGAGGGGAGMSSAANVSVAGAAGAYAESLIDATGITSISVTVGAGGGNAAANAATAGGAGGTSIFGSFITCTGGAGGGISGGVSNGGVATGGTIFNLNGQAGQGGMYATSIGVISSGVGGASFSGSNAQPHTSVPSDNGSYPGGGGAMGVYVSSSLSVASGRGADGYIIVEEHS